ncbi:UNVERIFIED_CONTAM: hypothetical protein FKN15_049339 [Acipenser sinensis]
MNSKLFPRTVSDQQCSNPQILCRTTLHSVFQCVSGSQRHSETVCMVSFQLRDSCFIPLHYLTTTTDRQAVGLPCHATSVEFRFSEREARLMCSQIPD